MGAGQRVVAHGASLGVVVGGVDVEVEQGPAEIITAGSVVVGVAIAVAVIVAGVVVVVATAAVVV